MSNQRFTRIHSKLRPASSGRKAWLLLVDAARTVAARASGTSYGPAVGSEELALDVKHLLRSVRAMEFPVQEASAVELADSFLHALKAFTHAQTVERRELCAPVLKATASAVWGMLEDLRADDATNSWKRQLPESER